MLCVYAIYYFHLIKLMRGKNSLSLCDCHFISQGNQSLLFGLSELAKFTRVLVLLLVLLVMSFSIGA